MGGTRVLSDMSFVSTRAHWPGFNHRLHFSAAGIMVCHLSGPGNKAGIANANDTFGVQISTNLAGNRWFWGLTWCCDAWTCSMQAHSVLLSSGVAMSHQCTEVPSICVSQLTSGLHSFHTHYRPTSAIGLRVTSRRQPGTDSNM